MGHIVRAQRRGNGNVFQAYTHHRADPAKFCPLDAAERTSVITGCIKELLHDLGRGAPLAKLVFKKSEGAGFETSLVIAPEGVHTGQ